MIAVSLISSVLSPLKPTDTGDDALNIMNIFHVKHLPIVQDEKWVGSISEDEILDNDTELTLAAFKPSYVRPFCFENDHIFEIIQKMASAKLTTIAVIDKQETYLGLITLEDILNFYGESFSFNEPGSIILLEVLKSNYSLAEIARIAESEGVLVISSFLTLDEETQNVLITLKINSYDVHRMVATYQRFGYIVSGTFSEEDYIDVFKERYDSLMNYLNI